MTNADCPRADQAGAGLATPIVTWRDSGYLLGDLLDEHVDITLPDGYRLDADSLPLPGRVAPWLEVRRAIVDPERHGGHENMTVTYQIFAEVEQATRVPIPAFKLRLRSNAGPQSVVVPEKSFLLSPALPASLSDEDRELKPSPPPQPLPRTGVVLALAASLAVALSCSVWLLWVHDRLPFLPRSPGPFARLWRRWRRRGRRGLPADQQAALLRDWHSALNETAGETVYASTLPRLFARAPFLAPLRARVEGAFWRSWQSFYGDREVPAPPAAEILELARQSAQCERGVPC